MSTVKIKGREVELKYTFNSFKYMADFNANDFNEMESKPFKIIPMLGMLLMGAVNHNPKIKISEDLVNEYLEEFAVEGDISSLMEELMTLLQESNFFKSLQKKS